MFWSRKVQSDWACLRCGRLNHPESLYCEFCGQDREEATGRSEPPRPVRPQASVRCPECGALCTVTALFCEECGIALKKATTDGTPAQEMVPLSPGQEEMVRCVQCGTMNPAQNRFCCHCSWEVRRGRKQSPAQQQTGNHSIRW